MEKEENDLWNGMSSLDESKIFDALHDKIRSGDFDGAKIPAIIISAMNELKNDSITPEDYETELRQLFEPKEFQLRASNFSWAEFLHSELKSNKIDPAHHLSDIIAKLHSTGILTLWNTMNYSRVFFALLDLGANPFEHRKRPVRLSLTTQTLPHALVKSTSISDAKKIKLIQQLVTRKQLNLAPCGLHNRPLPFLCLNNKKLFFLFPYIAKSDLIEHVRYQGLNLIHYICKTSWAPKEWLDLVDNIPHDALKRMLAKQDNKGKQGLIFLLPKLEKVSTHLRGVIEDLLKSSMVCDTTLREIIERIGVCGSEWIIQHTNKIAMKKPYPRFDKFVSERSGGRILDTRDVNAMTKYGNSEFPFYHIPPEVAMIICKDLDAATILCLFLTCKSLRERRDLFEIVAPGQKQFREEFPLVYCSVDEDASNSDWQVKFAKHSRLSANWSRGRFSVKTVAIDKADREISSDDPWYYHEKITLCDMDENWLIINDRKTIKLWNCQDQKIHDTGIKAEQYYSKPCTIIQSDASSTLPIFGYYRPQQFVIHRNNRLHCFNFSGTFPYAAYGTFIEPIGGNSILTTNQSYVFDMEAGKVVGKGLHRNTYSASYNPYLNVIALATQTPLSFVDRRINQITREMRLSGKNPYRNRNGCGYQVKFVDEFKVVHSSVTRLTVVDTRTMKELFSTRTQQLISGINKHGRAIVNNSDADLGVIWNLSRVEWERVIHLPPSTNALCNSRYAVFSQENCEDSVVCLDFDMN